MNKIIQGNCLDSLKTLPENSVDAIVTDPPYGLSFMGKKWDYDVPSTEIWQECLRVLKPGGYLLAFAGTRTQHRMAVRIEDAGFEIRDMIAWVYGSGFPKSLNIGKAVDKLQGNEREIVGANPNHRELQETGTMVGEPHTGDGKITKGTSEWEGWGTALKPALEPITVARKPISEKTVAENVLKWGVGGINIDGCRVEYQGDSDWKNTFRPSENIDRNCWHRDNNKVARKDVINKQGRFPANLIHDGSDEVVELFPNSKSAGEYKKDKLCTFVPDKAIFPLGHQTNRYAGDSGSASRFFYCAKASKRERNRGCEGLSEKDVHRYGAGIGEGLTPDAPSFDKNNHPTVKPIALMEYLVKLVSREGAVILDPFAGSGSTLIACKNLNRNYIGMELDKEYIKIAEARLNI
jgi:DNA modification methylase